MSKKERRAKGRKAESLFAKLVAGTYLQVDRNPPSIRAEEPVDVGNGKKKSVTHPDCVVRDPKFDREMFVEVTSGSGDNGHKKAQKKVADAAGVENYELVNGADLDELVEASSPGNRLNLLLNWFNWDDD
ncbi:hypothetical protein ACFL1M_00180 [Patescibacteria group bacterium]